MPATYHCPAVFPLYGIAATDAASANGADNGFLCGEFDASVRTTPRCK